MKLKQILPSSAVSTPILQPVPMTTGGVTAPSTPIGPVSINAVTGATSWNDFIITALTEGNSVINESPQNITIAGTRISRVSGLSAAFRVVGTNGLGIRHNVDFGYVPSGTAYVASGFEAGHHSKLAWDIIKPKLDSGGGVDLFSSVNHAVQNYTPNPLCWANSWDFSGVAVWNSEMNDFRKAGTLITRRHIVFNSHYRFSGGTSIRFRGSDGVVRTYTISAINPGAYPSGSFHENYNIADVCVGVLNQDVHESIAHYPVCGQWVLNNPTIPSENPPMDPLDPQGSWPQNSSSNDIFWGYWIAGRHQPAQCGISLNQNRHARLIAIASPQIAGPMMTRTQSVYYGVTINRSIQWLNLLLGPHNAPLPPFMAGYTDPYCPSVPISGDSSSPVFIPTSNSSMALLTTLSTIDGGFSLEQSLMNALIKATDSAAGISTGYTVTVAPDPTL